jgi:thiol:disulfide interchange protein DsbD
MNQPSEFQPSLRSRLGMLLIVLLVLAAGPSHSEDSFLPPEQAFVLAVDQGDAAGKVGLRWTIAPGYYLYRDRLDIKAAPGGILGEIVRPHGQRKADPYFGAVEVYHHSVSLQVDAARATALQLTWQGCAEAGLCYPPQKKTVVLNRSSSRRPAGGNHS